MAIQTIVKGDNGGDWSLYSHDAKIARIFDIEVLDMYDVNGNTVYLVPLSRVRYFQLVDGEGIELPVQQQTGVNIRVWIEGQDNVDTYIDCNRVNMDRLINFTVADLHLFLGLQEETKEDMWKKVATVPFENIRFVNYVNFIEELVTEGTIETETSVEPPKSGKKPLSYAHAKQK